MPSKDDIPPSGCISLQFISLFPKAPLAPELRLGIVRPVLIS